MAIQIKTKLDRIEIVFADDQATGAFVNILMGAWDDVSKRWIGEPLFKQVGLQVANELGFSMTLTAALTEATKQAFDTVESQRAQMIEKDNLIARLGEEKAVLLAENDRSLALIKNLLTPVAPTP